MPRITNTPVHAALHTDEYRCDACGGVFNFGWTEEEARAEAADNGVTEDNPAMVCDDCYNIMMGNPIPTREDFL